MPVLTHRIKKESFPIIVERDGYLCFYCSDEFAETHPREYDHLNNDTKDSRVENLVLCHHECNIKKKTSAEWQIKAMEKLKQNEKVLLACERILADTATTKGQTSQQEVNKTNFKIAEQFIQEHTLMEENVILRDAANAIVAICRDNNGTGSQAAVYRYIDTITNPYNGKYTISINEYGKNIIRRRTEN